MHLCAYVPKLHSWWIADVVCGRRVRISTGADILGRRSKHSPRRSGQGSTVGRMSRRWGCVGKVRASDGRHTHLCSCFATHHLPSHFSHTRPIAMPGSFRQRIRSEWCLVRECQSSFVQHTVACSLTWTWCAAQSEMEEGRETRSQMYREHHALKAKLAAAPAPFLSLSPPPARTMKKKVSAASAPPPVLL